MGFLGGMFASVALGVAKSWLADDKKDAAAKSNSLLAPPAPPFQSSDKYEVGKFNPDTSFQRSERGELANATPALKSTDPVSTEVMYWQQLFKNAVRDSQIRRELK